MDTHIEIYCSERKGARRIKSIRKTEKDKEVESYIEAEDPCYLGIFFLFFFVLLLFKNSLRHNPESLFTEVSLGYRQTHKLDLASRVPL